MSPRLFKLTIGFVILAFISSGQAHGVNGGTECAACTLLVSLGEQLAQLHNDTVVDSLFKLCDLLPSTYDIPCRVVVALAAPTLIKVFEEDVNADVACHAIGICRTDPGQKECRIFQKTSTIRRKLDHINPIWKEEIDKHTVKQIRSNICDSLPVLKALCREIYTKLDDHLPVQDLDNDKFSEIKTLRGSYWRGRDCNDGQADFYPGRKPVDDDIVEDSNCNGIMGVDPKSGKSYEELFCKGSRPMGLAILGDSATAHFHIPVNWFTPAEINKDIFKEMPMVIENEFDWPQVSYSTGFMNTSTWKTIEGPTDSLYLRMRQRNLCNHRDYQNIGVNGATTVSMNRTVQYSLARDQKADKPLVVIYSLLGNDVCNGHPDTIDHMTKPAEMKASALSSLKYLDKVLPNGSLVLMTGMVDGRILYDTLANRFHPLGQLNQDVRYRDIYEYLSCLQVSPCNGWLSTNETLRNITSERARQLSEAVKEASQSQMFANFRVEYIDFDFHVVINAWKKQGGKAWELIEPVDGFHPNQFAHALTADYIWKTLEDKFPDEFGKINPNNENILKIFGDQNGY
ncbi:acyloxyacyl hydrolase-like isoform X1 [Anneissia japonica]|uniref:acyloxyacyl hydrolase-like isoform X1 n=1 Tax=Anneissia japonica TaxID=1529436 RepID=UPI0014257731|nr:acyloxyacyl hydrolase-like isoform X1 [Anneissia japonica]